MLKETDRAKGTITIGGYKSSGGQQCLPPDDPPTLAELGLTKRESSNAQFLSKLPEEDFINIKTGKITTSKAKKLANLKVKHDRIVSETKKSLVEDAIIVNNDCLTILDTLLGIDLLLTDPPYFTDGDFTSHISACLAKVKTTGQAYVFASSDPLEIMAYLSIHTQFHGPAETGQTAPTLKEAGEE